MANIYQLPTVLTGTVGVFPNFKYMVTRDNLATITTAGYLNQVDLQSNPVSTTDILQVMYNFNNQTQVGDYAAFTVSIADGIITLVETVNPGDVQLPVVSGHFANFIGTSGKIGDDGFSPSNASLSKVTMSNGGVTVGDFPAFDDVNGSLVDSGLAPSAPGPGNIPVVPSTTDIGSVAVFSDSTGSLASYPLFSYSAATKILNVHAATNGGISLAAVENSAGNYIAIISNPDSLSQHCVYHLPDGSAPDVNICINAGGGLPNNTPKAYVFAGTSGQSIPSGVYTEIDMDTILFDTASGYSPNEYTILVGGFYLITFQALLNLNPGDENVEITAALYINGSGASTPLAVGSFFTCTPPDDLNFGVNISGVVQLFDADVLTLRLFHDAGSPRDIVSNSGQGNTFLSLSLLV